MSTFTWKPSFNALKQRGESEPSQSSSSSVERGPERCVVRSSTASLPTVHFQSPSSLPVSFQSISSLPPVSQSLSMLVDEQRECVVCCCEYSHSQRVPRVLHCSHTFCAPCLQRLSRLEGSVRCVSCPLCRWITCTRASLTLPGALWVNTGIWDRITEEQTGKEPEPEEDFHKTGTLLQSELLPGFMSVLQRLFSCVLQQRGMDS